MADESGSVREKGKQVADEAVTNLTTEGLLLGLVEEMVFEGARREHTDPTHILKALKLSLRELEKNLEKESIGEGKADSALFKGNK